MIETPVLEGFELFLNDLDDLYEAIELLKRSEYMKEYLSLSHHLHQVQLSLESITFENNGKEETDDN